MLKKIILLVMIGAVVGCSAANLVVAQALDVPEPYPHVVELYRGASGKLPNSSHLTFVSMGRSGGTQKYAKGVTVMDTSAAFANIAGYVASTSPLLKMERANGFELSFSMQLLSEAHRGADRNSDGIADRAGFSVLLLDDDAKGIELGFWPRSVWAQADGVQPARLPLLTHAESAAIIATQMAIYRLQIKGDVYTLFREDKKVLSGPVRDYHAFDGFPDVYEVPNFIFLGDNSGSALARVAIRDIVLSY